MELSAWVTLALIVALVIVLARELIAPAAAVSIAVVVLLLLGIIDSKQALSGFSNPAPITVAALYILARAVEKTGVLTPLVAATLGNGVSPRWQLARLLTPTAAASAFLNNTPIVAMLAPQVEEWAIRRGVSPSLLLMPVSFATILGGVITLIGTSTNLVVSGLLVNSGMPGIGMFELTGVGLPVVLVGVAEHDRLRAGGQDAAHEARQHRPRKPIVSVNHIWPLSRDDAT